MLAVVALKLLDKVIVESGVAPTIEETLAEMKGKLLKEEQELEKEYSRTFIR